VFYKVRVYRDTYSVFLEPFSIEDLSSSEHIHPPIVRRQRGRPKTKRYRKGDYQRRHKKCGTCSEKGHDKRTCRNQPVANGQRQRARDRVLLSDSDSNAQQNEIIEEADSTDEDLQAQLEQDLQFRQEIHAFEQRLDQHSAWQSARLAEAVAQAEAAEQAAAARVISHGPIESNAGEDGSGEESSGLSTVSSSRFGGLSDDWWKENGGSEVVAVMLQSQGNA
jgi:hypothetical protein